MGTQPRLEAEQGLGAARHPNPGVTPDASTAAVTSTAAAAIAHATDYVGVRGHRQPQTPEGTSAVGPRAKTMAVEVKWRCLGRSGSIPKEVLK